MNLQDFILNVSRVAILYGLFVHPLITIPVLMALFLLVWFYDEEEPKESKKKSVTHEIDSILREYRYTEQVGRVMRRLIEILFEEIGNLMEGCNLIHVSRQEVRGHISVGMSNTITRDGIDHSNIVVFAILCGDEPILLYHDSLTFTLLQVSVFVEALRRGLSGQQRPSNSKLNFIHYIFSNPNIKMILLIIIQMVILHNPLMNPGKRVLTVAVVYTKGNPISGRTSCE